MGRHKPTDHMPFQGGELYLRVASANIGGKTAEIASYRAALGLTAPARRALLWLIPAIRFWVPFWCRASCFRLVTVCALFDN